MLERIHPKKGKTLVGNKMVVKLNRRKSRLKQYAKKGKSERRISKGRTVRIEKMIHELIAEKHSSYIKERLEELSKEDKFSVDNFWKIKRNFTKQLLRINVRS